MTAPDTLRLAEELARARSDLADLLAEFAELADPAVLALDDEHDSEGSTIGYERARVAGLITRTERRISDLEAALERARAGSYRRCEDCGGDISAERLQALPATRVCVRCSAGSAGAPRLVSGGHPARRRFATQGHDQAVEVLDGHRQR